jgi:hypothetical protein
MHPATDREIDVAESVASRYIGQGWRPPAEDAPKGNAPRDEWADYALSKGFTEADIEGKSRAELRAALA